MLASFFHALQWTAAGVSTRFFPCIPGDVCPPFFHANACFCPVSLHARFPLYLSFSPFLPWLSTATVSWLISSIDGNGSPGRLYRGLVLNGQKTGVNTSVSAFKSGPAIYSVSCLPRFLTLTRQKCCNLQCFSFAFKTLVCAVFCASRV